MSSVQRELSDVVIIGSGVGGGSVAWQLAGSGAQVLVLERGPFLPREAQNWDLEEIFVRQRYKTQELWYADGRAFRPGMFYFVGGLSKFYGTAMFRFRERDFECVQHEEGESPAWPIRYAQLEPWYTLAERLFGVRGQAGIDPTEPARSAGFEHPPIPHEPVLQAIHERLQAQGLAPFAMPSAIDFGAGGRCLRCSNCDALPCKVDAKGDAEMRLIRPALEHANVELRTGVRVERLLTDDSGRRITAVDVLHDGVRKRICGKLFVLSAGAINSAALLLRSANGAHPRGLANSSDVVGRHYMTHNTTALMAVHPLRRNRTHFPKTLAVHDFYFGDPTHGYDYPLGSLQLLGKIREPMLRGPLGHLPKMLRSLLAQHSVDWYAQSEDLPDPDSRVSVRADGAINLHWKRSNLRAHQRWVAKCREILRATGYPLVLAKGFGTEVVSHQCGTVRFGADAKTSALDALCRAWDHENLYVVDAGFFPSSAAVNPALTVAAQALRVGQHIREQVL
ncbi:GMC family oxidoreductase [Verminephrobacter aporrectodeae subsp. tuberculatae]|uniref:GMC family oxidoreductase n=1 Tax=Verminephrobacter aporrectodeae subsp. tuberculatae TaxID=1110392 RepID=A0ABT3KPT6_9BURK|nr:GMC family oxidoreductase [Verminephrobacter aporrectodeae]MCW5320152.1 GMC family oxidoreductase [Verminephrobacter aporrectodeae subsp. tuberculatae]